MNARGNIATNVLATITAIIVVLVIIAWFIKDNPYKQLELADRIQEDLLQVNYIVNHACTTDNYTRSYRTVTRDGALIFDGRDVCIEATYTHLSLDSRKVRDCVRTNCVIYEDKRFDLSKPVVIRK